MTFTSLPLALRRRVPGRTSLICIPPERLAKSVQPEIHVCPMVGCPGGGTLLFAGDRAAFSLWIWSGLSCTYLTVSLNQIRTTKLPSLWVMKPCTTPGPAGPCRVIILSPITNPGPELVQFPLRFASRGCMKVSSAGISKSPWVGKLTVAMRSLWRVPWDVMVHSSPSLRSGCRLHALIRAKQVLWMAYCCGVLHRVWVPVRGVLHRVWVPVPGLFSTVN